MNPYSTSAAICIAAASLLLGTAGQDLIGIGLNWQKNIFVQEYWRDGKPVYAIANRTDKDQMLTAAAWRTRNALAGPWKVPAHSITFADASGLTKKNRLSLLEFTLRDGASLFALPPRQQLFRDGHPTPPILNQDSLSLENSITGTTGMSYRYVCV